MQFEVDFTKGICKVCKKERLIASNKKCLKCIENALNDDLNGQD